MAKQIGPNFGCEVQCLQGWPDGKKFAKRNLSFSRNVVAPMAMGIGYGGSIKIQRPFQGFQGIWDTWHLEAGNNATNL